MPLVILKKAGEPGSVAINSDRVTHVRSTSTRFTDVFFGEHLISVEGTFEQVVAQLSGRPEPGTAKTWIKAAPSGLSR